MLLDTIILCGVIGGKLLTRIISVWRTNKIRRRLTPLNA
jgi:hypothetical protein